MALRKTTCYRLFFLTIYAILSIGMLVSSLYVFSYVFSGSNCLVSSGRFSSSVASASQPKRNFLDPIWMVPPPGSKIPPLEAFRLRKELVQPRVKDNVIVLTFGNFAFMDFILNWVKHLTDLSVNNLIVGAMDIRLLEALYWKGIPVFDMGSSMGTAGARWGSAPFHRLGRDKIFLLESFLHFGFEILMCDTDTVWLKNPLPFLARFPEADVLVSTDQLVPTVVGDRLDDWTEVTECYNIGIFHWRPMLSSIKFVQEWMEQLRADENKWDQDVFNALVTRNLGPSVDEDSNLVYASNGEIKLGLLPMTTFCSGHTYFVEAIYKQLRLEPYVVHTTFQYAAAAGNRHRMREAMIFDDPPEYYVSAGGFLTFRPDIPKALLLDGEHNIESHFILVNYQIKQIRAALAIASLLGRTLAMPPLWCRLDRMWFPHPGVLSGTLTWQPFICPLDHVFRVDAMLEELTDDEFGSGIHFREYSFFDNPSVPLHVKNSWLNVQLCPQGLRGCKVSNETNPWGLLKLPKWSREETLKTVFASFKDVKVIQFLSMQDAFQGFSNKTREGIFKKRVKTYTSYWCCAMNMTRGHIHYDMYWDEQPGWKPIPNELD